jgi:hypothetical protein
MSVAIRIGVAVVALAAAFAVGRLSVGSPKPGGGPGITYRIASRKRLLTQTYGP